jgi:hypothetical protein
MADTANHARPPWAGSIDKRGAGDMATYPSSRAGRVLARINDALDELDEARQRRLEAQIELFAPRRPGTWRRGPHAIDESRADYEQRAWDEFTC